MRGMQAHVHQHMTGAPLISIPGGRGLGLQRELELWAYEQDSGHIQALADPPVILSIQLLRFRVNQSGEVNKLSDSVPLVHRIYVPRFTLQLLQMFRCLLESEARSTCTPFERRLRAELLEQALMPAEAEQVAGLIYDSLLPAEIDAWNRKLHEESIDAYWMPS